MDESHKQCSTKITRHSKVLTELFHYLVNQKRQKPCLPYEVRIVIREVVTIGNTASFWGLGNIQFLNLGDGYSGVFTL